MTQPCGRQQLVDYLVVLFNSTLVARAANRTNLGNREDKKSHPRSVCIGAITSNGTRIGAATYRHDQFPVPTHNIALLRKPTNRHGYLSIQLNQMHAHEKLPLHVDRDNSGLNSVISVGRYEGGRLWIEGYGNDPPPTLCAPCSTDESLLGGHVDPYQKWTFLTRSNDTASNRSAVGPDTRLFCLLLDDPAHLLHPNGADLTHSDSRRKFRLLVPLRAWNHVTHCTHLFLFVSFATHHLSQLNAC